MTSSDAPDDGVARPESPPEGSPAATAPGVSSRPPTFPLKDSTRPEAATTESKDAAPAPGSDSEDAANPVPSSPGPTPNGSGDPIPTAPPGADSSAPAPAPTPTEAPVAASPASAPAPAPVASAPAPAPAPVAPAPATPQDSSAARTNTDDADTTPSDTSDSGDTRADAPEGDTAADDVEDAAEEIEPPRPHRPYPRVIAVANQKGGVGKTTSTINLGACMAELGHRTLIVDLDPQANASTGLGIDPRALEFSLYDVILRDVPMQDCIEPTAIKNLFLAPSSLDLAGAEIELVPQFSREHRLRTAIESISADYDYVFIDCPPSLGLLTINALTAAKEVCVPIQCEYYALEGLGQLIRNVELVNSSLNPQLDISTIILVMYDGRTKLAGQVVDEVREHFGNRVCKHVIPRSVRLSEAPSYGQPITTFDSSSKGAQAYRDVAKEIDGVEA